MSIARPKKIYSKKDHLEIFCITYLKGFDVNEACQAVGISDSLGYRYLNDKRIKAKLSELTEQRLAKANISVERILQELANAAFMDIADIVDPETGVVYGNVHDIPEGARRTITEITQKTLKPRMEYCVVEFGEDGEMRAKVPVEVEQTVVKCMSKEKTLELLGKYREIAMFKEVVETNVTDVVASVRSTSLEDRVAGLEKDRAASMFKP